MQQISVHLYINWGGRLSAVALANLGMADLRCQRIDFVATLVVVAYSIVNVDTSGGCDAGNGKKMG